MGYNKNPIKDILGQKFGRLVTRKLLRKNGRPYWVCKCECGKDALVNHYKLLIGHTQSCGCLQVDSIKTHGKTNTKEYRCWGAMLSRCTNPKNKYYYNYGGRGIKIEWKCFEDFLRDMGEKPSDKHSIDRINVNGNYSKENCRWATKEEQDNNKRNNHFIFFAGLNLTVRQWSRKLGVEEGLIHGRLKRGWNIENTLTKQLQTQSCKELDLSFLKDFQAK